MQVNGKKQQRRIRTILWSISIIAFLFALFVGVNVRRALQNAAGFAHFWQEKANKPVPANAIRLVALGDSATQAIGADTPMEGFVERITTYVQAKTGRPVHITNVSAGGATYADVAKIFTHEGRRLDIFSWLPPHLNSKGYAYWFLAFQPEVDTILQRLKTMR